MSDKKLAAVKKSIDFTKNYSLDHGIEILKTNSFVKFDQSLEIVMKLGVDPKRSDQVVKGYLSLPYGTGKKVRVLVICKESLFEETKFAGADFVGGIEVVEAIHKGEMSTDAFDVCITTPDMIGNIGKVARILGQKKMMPNLAAGTITKDVSIAIKNAKTGQVRYRIDKAGIIHAAVGKLSFETKHLLDNIAVFVKSVKDAKPTGVKSSFIKSVFLSSTMGPGLSIDLTCI